MKVGLDIFENNWPLKLKGGKGTLDSVLEQAQAYTVQFVVLFQHFKLFLPLLDRTV